MPSQIDDTVPVYGAPTTLSVRNNFGLAKTEISDLQSRMAGSPFLPLSGGTLTGNLTLNSAPVTDLQAATKAYVDSAVASGALYRGTYRVAANVPALDQVTPLTGYSWSCVTVQPSVPEALIVALPPLAAGTMVSNGDSLHYSAAQGWALIKGSALTIDVTDARYVALAGSTMTGPLFLSGPPTAALGAASKAYVDGAVGGVTTASIGALALAGGTMTGPIVLPGAPTTALQAAPKQYVDTAISSALVPLAPLASPALTGTPTAPTPATADNTTQIATTAYVKAQGYAPLASPALTGIPTSSTPPAADNTQRIATTAWVRSQTYAPLNSPNFSGTPTAPNPPGTSSDTTIPTTGWVKSQGYAVGNLGNYLPLAGGTLVGNFNINAPTSAQITLVKAGGGDYNLINGFMGATQLWQLQLGNNTNDFALVAATGPYAGPRMTMNQGTGTTSFVGAIYATSYEGSGGVQATLRTSNTDLIYFETTSYYMIVHAGGGPFTITNGLNVRSFQLYTPSGGGPVNWGLQVVDTAGNSFNIYIDQSSDARLKENIRPSEIDALALLLKLPVCAFDWRAEVVGWSAAHGKTGEEREAALAAAQAHPVAIGLLAQDLQELIPEAVVAAPPGSPRPEDSPYPEDVLSLDRQALIPYLVRAVQQLTDRVTELERR